MVGATLCLRRGARSLALGLALLGSWAGPLEAQDSAVPPYERDRGDAVPSSLSGTYIRRGEFLFYAFAEYARDHDREYDPRELGFGLEADFRGKFHSTAGQLFLAYGVTDWLALELEGAYLDATLRKSPSDPSAVPARIHEKGLADLEGQVRLRLLREGPSRPEVFGFLELTARTNPDKLLISEEFWDVRPGIGVIRGFGFRTLTVRITGEYNREESHPILGEVGVEYLKGLSDRARLFLAVEGGEGGAPDEFEFIGGLRLRVAEGIFFKVDNSVGITSKATDWTPQAGLLISFGPGARR